MQNWILQGCKDLARAVLKDSQKAYRTKPEFEEAFMETEDLFSLYCMLAEVETDRAKRAIREGK